MTERISPGTSWLPVRLRVEDYLLLDDSGAFDAYAKTELIEGEILFMNAQHRPHALVKSLLYIALVDSLRGMGSKLFPMVEVSFSLPPHSVPEPDIVLTSEPEGEGLVPLPSVSLIVEVSDTTLDNDLGRKAAIYAAARVPEYWVADVKGRIIHQMWLPLDGDFSQRRAVPFGDMVTATTIAGLSIDTAKL